MALAVVPALEHLQQGRGLIKRLLLLVSRLSFHHPGNDLGSGLYPQLL
jgi:hypothetical protein